MAAATRTLRIDEVAALRKRVSGAVGNAVLGQHNGQILFRNWNGSTLRAMDERNRRAPVTLARDAPVAQSERRLFFAQTQRGQIRGDRIDGIAIAEAVVLARVDAVAALFVLVPRLPRVRRKVFVVE